MNITETKITLKKYNFSEYNVDELISFIIKETGIDITKLKCNQDKYRDELVRDTRTSEQRNNWERK